MDVASLADDDEDDGAVSTDWYLDGSWLCDEVERVSLRQLEEDEGEDGDCYGAVAELDLVEAAHIFLEKSNLSGREGNGAVVAAKLIQCFIDQVKRTRVSSRPFNCRVDPRV